MSLSWAKTVDRHIVGPYEVLEYEILERIKLNSNSQKEVSGAILYHGFIDGKDMGESWDSLDEALAGLIVRRNLGPDHRVINQHFIAGILALKENNT